MQAPVGAMKKNYLMFHTMAPELEIEDLKEISGQKTGDLKHWETRDGFNS